MQDISKAGYGLLCFVDAVLKYCVVFKEVKPKQDKLKELEKDYELVRTNLSFYRSYNFLGSKLKVLSQIIKSNRTINNVKQYILYLLSQ
jgi:hypothetical protein